MIAASIGLAACGASAVAIMVYTIAEERAAIVAALLAPFRKD
jgi:hypothetical protein